MNKGLLHDKTTLGFGKRTGTVLVSTKTGNISAQGLVTQPKSGFISLEFGELQVLHVASEPANEIMRRFDCLFAHARQNGVIVANVANHAFKEPKRAKNDRPKKAQAPVIPQVASLPLTTINAEAPHVIEYAAAIPPAELNPDAPRTQDLDNFKLLVEHGFAKKRDYLSTIHRGPKAMGLVICYNCGAYFHFFSIRIPSQISSLKKLLTLNPVLDLSCDRLTLEEAGIRLPIPMRIRCALEQQ